MFFEPSWCLKEIGLLGEWRRGKAGSFPHLRQSPRTRDHARAPILRGELKVQRNHGTPHPLLHTHPPTISFL